MWDPGHWLGMAHEENAILWQFHNDSNLLLYMHCSIKRFAKETFRETLKGRKKKSTLSFQCNHLSVMMGKEWLHDLRWKSPQGNWKKMSWWNWKWCLLPRGCLNFHQRVNYSLNVLLSVCRTFSHRITFCSLCLS